MEPQPWTNLGLEWRRPGVAVAGAVWYLLHTQPQVHEVIAAAVALLVLRCARPLAGRQPPVALPVGHSAAPSPPR
ncbi:hypothetical protein [Streptomyces sp. WG5]|uniref:hypothetical protein n=1 Tax=Streptomyces sp. WG5 TaxID=3417648 RepID=UPI003CF2AEE2